MKAKPNRGLDIHEKKTYWMKTHLCRHPEPLEVDDTLERKMKIPNTRPQVMRGPAQVVPRACPTELRQLVNDKLMLVDGWGAQHVSGL